MSLRLDLLLCRWSPFCLVSPLIREEGGFGEQCLGCYCSKVRWSVFINLLQVFYIFLAACQISTFALITDAYYNSNYLSFDRARPGEFYTALHPLPFSHYASGIAYALHTISWILSILVALSVLLTGVSADAGHRWAAGNRAYRPIA